MCNPVVFAVIAAAGAAASYVGQVQTAKRAQKSIDQQNQIQADQISDQAGQQMSEAAKAARAARAQAIVTAGESGINLGSNSFLATMQSSISDQVNNGGLILHNEANQQKARQSQAQTLMAQYASRPTALAGGLQIAGAAASAYTGYKAA